MEIQAEGVLVQLSAALLSGVLQSSGLTPTPLSPLAGAQQAAAPLQDPALAGRPEVQRAVAIAATPDAVVRFRVGGGSVELLEFTLCHCKAAGSAVVLVLPAENSTVQLRLFSGIEAFLAWLTDLYAGKNELTVANFIPPTVELGEFLYLLHAIDAYRIASFKAMLDYTPGRPPSLSPASFHETMQRSVESKDIRWLLPAFLLLTPGLDPAGLDLRAEQTAVLTDKGFLNIFTDPATQQPALGFGEAGRTMGVEFYRTWLAAVGFETRICAPEGIRAINRGFLAPTALANHLVLLDTEPGKPARINHQAMTFNQLQDRLQRLFAEALAAPTAPLSAAQPVAVDAPAAQQPAPPSPAAAEGGAPRFCTACGSQAAPGTNFCLNCGTKL